MQMHFFAIPALDPSAAQAELNAFLAAHRVAGVERQFVQAGIDSHWVVCLNVVSAAAPLPAGLKAEGSRAGRVDYKQLLGDDEFTVFAELRHLRKQLADAGGVPLYAVFSNEQLAAMVQQRVQDETALGEIAGVGDARVQRYGAAFVERLRSAWARQS